MSFDWEKDNTCLRRAVYVGLRFAGIVDDCLWIPQSPTIEVLEEVIERYPLLTAYGLHGCELATFGAVPALVVYKVVPAEFTVEGLPVSHAVFLSDVHPVTKMGYRFDIDQVVLGWEILSPR